MCSSHLIKLWSSWVQCSKGCHICGQDRECGTWPFRLESLTHGPFEIENLAHGPFWRLNEYEKGVKVTFSIRMWVIWAFTLHLLYSRGWGVIGEGACNCCLQVIQFIHSFNIKHYTSTADVCFLVSQVVWPYILLIVSVDVSPVSVGQCEVCVWERESDVCIGKLLTWYWHV